MRIGVISVLLLSALACGEIEPCDDYINYMCDCHDAEEDVSCEDLSNTLGAASPDVQSQCAIDLSEQRSEDEEEGLECETL